MKKDFFSTSICVLILDGIGRKFVYLKTRSNGIYPDSVTRAILVKWQNLVYSAVVWVKNSFLHRIYLLMKKLVTKFIKVFLEKVEIIQLPSDTIYNSKFVQLLIAFYCSIKKRLQRYSRTSAVAMEIESFKKEFSSSPIGAIGIVLVSAIGVNIVLSIFLQKPITLWGWLMRILFLLLGLSAFFCQADLVTLKRNSFFTKNTKK